MLHKFLVLFSEWWASHFVSPKCADPTPATPAEAPPVAEPKREKVLIAILTCHARRHFAAFQRATWVKDVKGADVRFFLGHGESQLRADEVLLDVDDSYRGLREKIRAVCRWALARGYLAVFKVDDDTHVQPVRLLNSGFEQFDYVGREVNGFAAGGSGYWLSRRAMRYIAFSNPEGYPMEEDRFVAEVLQEHGITVHDDPQYTDENSPRVEEPISFCDHGWKRLNQNQTPDAKLMASPFSVPRPLTEGTNAIQVHARAHDGTHISTVEWRNPA